MKHLGDPEVLLARARSRDRDALDQLLDFYGNYVHMLASVQIATKRGARLDPSDLVQETMLDAFRGFAGFSGHSQREFMSWLRRILVHNLADHAKSRSNRTADRQQYLEEIDQSASRLAGETSTPSAQAVRKENAVILADALTRLPSDYREVIVLRQLLGLPFAEVAGRLRRSPGATRQLWVRALERLRTELERVL